MARFLWGSAAALLLVLLVVVVIALRNIGQPPMVLLNPSVPLVDEGVAAVMLCGDQPERETVNMTAEAIVRPEWGHGPWTYRTRDDCVVYYHHPVYWGD